MILQSNPPSPIPPIFGLAKNGGIPKTAVYRIKKTPIWDLKMGGDIGDNIIIVYLLIVLLKICPFSQSDQEEMEDPFSCIPESKEDIIEGLSTKPFLLELLLNHFNRASHSKPEKIKHLVSVRNVIAR